MMIVSDDGSDSVSGAAINYTPDAYYWVVDTGKKQIAEVRIVNGHHKWKTIDGHPKAFVDRVILGPIAIPK